MKMMIRALVLMFAFSGAVQAAVVGKKVDYREGRIVLEGYVAYDDAIAGKRPGVVVLHDWMGPSDFTREKARELAKLGYVAFAADIYGKKVRPKDSTEAASVSGFYKGNLDLLRKRARAAVNTLIRQPQTDSERLGAIGFCFGGTTALQLARSGAPLAGVVSFHGNLGPASVRYAKQIEGKVLALHGADDPYVPDEEVAAFEAEMREAGVDWQLVKYGGAVHSFTNPKAGTDVSKGAAYNPDVSRRAWQAMQDFFAEVFQKPE